jgi:hypothetical protein
VTGDGKKRKPNPDAAKTSEESCPTADRESHIRQLTPAHRINLESLTERASPLAIQDPQIEFSGENESRDEQDVLTLESYRSLPAKGAWPDLSDVDLAAPSEDDFDDEGVPDTIREPRRTASETARFDQRISNYLDASKEQIEHALKKKKKK